MLEEFSQRIQNAKDKQFRLLQRFHIGDAVYPFWLKNFLVYGTVIDIDTVARKIICDFNGVQRQFCPQDLMLVNPAFVQNGSKTASMKKAKPETHLSPDTDNGIDCSCKECGGQIAVSYNEKSAKTDFVCTSCGRRISQDKISPKTKIAMRKQANKDESEEIADELVEIAKMILGE